MKIEDEDEHEDENQITNHQTNMKKLISNVTHVTLVTAFACGCTVLSYTSPNGEHFTRGSLGANTSISSLAIEAGTNGVRRVELRGYQNDSSQALSAVTEAAVKAAIESAK